MVDKKERIKKLMDKVSNLLSKTVDNGCTPEEAALAATKAQELIAKYHLDMREVEDDSPDDIGSDKINYTRKWQLSLAAIVAKNMRCLVVQTVKSRTVKYITFVGSDADRLAALETYDGLILSCKIGLARYKREYKATYGTTSGVEESYCLGFLKAVRSAMNEQCRALALVTPKEVENKLHELFPRLGSERRFRMTSTIGSAYNAGYNRGSDIAGRKRIR